MKNKNQKIGIFGYGEVGQAVAKFYQNPKIKDLKRDDGLMGVEILNVCIPWSENFIEIVKKEIESCQPGLTVIHSTVAPGTTKKLAEKFDNMVVHSPVRGVHPNLYMGIKTFVKFIGAEREKAGVKAAEHFKSLGIKVKVVYPAATTELGKILDTTYYGLCIAWHGEMKKMCDKLGVDFKNTVIDFNETYNKGYKKLGKNNVIRPVLYPPEGAIGGHCVIPNAEILGKEFKSLAVDLVLKYRGRC